MYCSSHSSKIAAQVWSDCAAVTLCLVFKDNNLYKLLVHRITVICKIETYKKL